MPSRSPPGSPGYFAFKMYGNYAGAGSSFAGTAVAATTTDVDHVSAYAAVDRSGKVRVILLNKTPDDVVLPVRIAGDRLGTRATVYRYSSEDPSRIVSRPLDASDTLSVELPASSIALVELAPAS